MTAWRALVAALGSTLAGAALAFGAGMDVTPQRLTVFTSTEQLPPVTCKLAPAADAYGAELSTLLDSNFGTAPELHVQSFALADKRTLVRFNLSACSIPATATVLSARLTLTLTRAPSSSRTYVLHRATQAWTETGVTWNNQPTTASSSTASAATGTTAGAAIGWDVAGDVSSVLAGTSPNHGWRIRDSTEDAIVAVESRFAARESTTAEARPSLVVKYQR